MVVQVCTQRTSTETRGLGYPAARVPKPRCPRALTAAIVPLIGAPRERPPATVAVRC